MADELATLVDDTAYVIDEEFQDISTDPNVDLEQPWIRFGARIFKLFEGGAFRVHAPRLHDEIRLAVTRNIGYSQAEIYLVAWDESVTYFARTQGVAIPTGNDPTASERYPRTRWLPAFRAVVSGLHGLASELRDACQQPVKSVEDGLSGQARQVFSFLCGRNEKTSFDDLRNESSLWTKTKPSDDKVDKALSRLSVCLQKIQAPYALEWSKADGIAWLSSVPRTNPRTI
jgi:hypothetical protein